MTDHTEEQELELEALEALFTREGEFEKLSSSSFRLSLVPCQDNEGTNHVAVTLSVQYSATYPDAPPEWEIQESKGLDSEVLQEFKKEVTEAMEREVGAPMMYTIAEFIQDWLRARNKPQQSMYDQMMNRENAGKSESSEDEDEDEDREDEPQYTGLGEKQLCAAAERCTKEEFERWAERFRQEMIDAGIWKGSAISGSRKGVLTGKQLFERDASLATADTSSAEAEADEDEESAKAKNGDGGAEKRMFWTDESLFDGADEDLPSD
ncbi:RWD domain-containing protein [Besnoitia besnoiti]|uniref:RWD domain-containing protein n=1 Tax=Besnoitia besnoiti TaxID=94643 RepID=A0A2A9M3L9_BESBE|nr:RWD domain-containing protein [Besnoitia besnoiti]PFH31814.1 RWD domain-containing protein [Besnoitia besnoiti]